MMRSGIGVMVIPGFAHGTAQYWEQENVVRPRSLRFSEAADTRLLSDTKVDVLSQSVGHVV